MHRKNDYFHSHEYMAMGNYGPYQQHAKDICILMRFCKATYVDEATFSELIIFIRDNFKDWDEVKPYRLRLKVIRILRKSFKRFNRLMAKDKWTVEHIEEGRFYSDIRPAFDSYIERMTTALDQFEFMDKSIEDHFNLGNLTASELIELKRDLYTALQIIQKGVR